MSVSAPTGAVENVFAVEHAAADATAATSKPRVDSAVFRALKYFNNPVGAIPDQHGFEYDKTGRVKVEIDAHKPVNAAAALAESLGITVKKATAAGSSGSRLRAWLTLDQARQLNTREWVVGVHLLVSPRVSSEVFLFLKKGSFRPAPFPDPETGWFPGSGPVDITLTGLPREVLPRLWALGVDAVFVGYDGQHTTVTNVVITAKQACQLDALEWVRDVRLAAGVQVAGSSAAHVHSK